MADVIAYIDGFNLYHGLRDRYRHRYLWLDLVQLVRHLRPHDSVLAVRYLTAVVRNDPPAQARQQAYLDALRAHSGSCLQIVHGRYQAKQQACRRCGAAWTSYEEKETDVNIAVSLTEVPSPPRVALKIGHAWTRRTRDLKGCLRCRPAARSRSVCRTA